MFLDKVKDLDLTMISPGNLLVEIVTIKSTIILQGEEGSNTDISHLQVVKSTSENIFVGDIILETRNGANDLKNYSEKDGVKYFILNAYDVSHWTTQENFDTSRKYKPKLVQAPETYNTDIISAV